MSWETLESSSEGNFVLGFQGILKNSVLKKALLLTLKNRISMPTKKVTHHHQ
mgnify:CR=1 FL=1